MNAEVILKYMTVEDGLITLPHGTQYKIMVLPKLETMRPELITKINQLVNDGAVILGPPPKRSPSLQNQPQADLEVKKMAELLWGEIDGVNVKARQVGKGLIINGMDMTEAFDLIDTVNFARENKTPLLARGGGTSQCGQTVNNAIVIDNSKYFRRISEWNTNNSGPNAKGRPTRSSN